MLTLRPQALLCLTGYISASPGNLHRPAAVRRRNLLPLPGRHLLQQPPSPATVGKMRRAIQRDVRGRFLHSRHPSCASTAATAEEGNRGRRLINLSLTEQCVWLSDPSTGNWREAGGWGGEGFHHPLLIQQGPPFCQSCCDGQPSQAGGGVPGKCAPHPKGLFLLQSNWGGADALGHLYGYGDKQQCPGWEGGARQERGCPWPQQFPGHLLYWTTGAPRVDQPFLPPLPHPSIEDGCFRVLGASLPVKRAEAHMRIRFSHTDPQQPPWQTTKTRKDNPCTML